MGTLGDTDPLKVPFKRAISRVQKGSSPFKGLPNTT